MVFADTTKKQDYDNRFLFTKKYQGQTFSSLDEVEEFLKKEYPVLRFFDYKLIPQLRDRSNIVLIPFSYIAAKQGSEKFSNLEFLGFKLDSESIFRMRAPHFEETQETVCFGKENGYRLYATHEKKLELLIHTF
jgi:hypothetical protein